jgi:hypothetical protein
MLELLVQTELLALRVSKAFKGTQALLVRKVFKGILELLVQTELLVLRVSKAFKGTQALLVLLGQQE